MTDIPPNLLVMVLGVVLGATVLVGLWARWQAENRGRRPASELTAYQVAMLAGGRRRVAETALAYLDWAGVIEAREQTSRLVLKAPPKNGVSLAVVERALVGSISPSGSSPTLPLASAREGAREVAAGMDGLLVPMRTRALLNLITVVPAGVVGVFGLVWALGRASAGLPVGFGPLIPVLAGVYLVWWLSNQPAVTLQGRRALEKVRLLYDDSLAMAEMGVTSLPIEKGLYVVALYGPDAMTGGLSPLRKVIRGR
jgi:uncharacterized protein (TIGR04222 family)